MHQQTVAVAGVLRVYITPVSGNPWWLRGQVKTKTRHSAPPNPGKTAAGTGQKPTCAETGVGKGGGFRGPAQPPTAGLTRTGTTVGQVLPLAISPSTLQSLNVWYPWVPDKGDRRGQNRCRYRPNPEVPRKWGRQRVVWHGDTG